jgi:hypothetical protein
MCNTHGKNDMLASIDYSNFKMLNAVWFSNIVIFQLACSIAGIIPYEYVWLRLENCHYIFVYNW